MKSATLFARDSSKTIVKTAPKQTRDRKGAGFSLAAGDCHDFAPQWNQQVEMGLHGAKLADCPPTTVFTQARNGADASIVGNEPAPPSPLADARGSGQSPDHEGAGLSRRTLLGRALFGAAPLLFVRRLTGQTKQEMGRQHVHDALDALGGKKFLDIRNQIASGRAYSFYNSRVRGLARITVYDRFDDMQPNMPAEWLPLARREVYTEKGDFFSLFVNGKGWEVTFQGARPLPLDMLQRYRLGVRRDFFYFLRYRLEENGLYFYNPGMEIVDNTPTNAVEISDAEGETITVYLKQSDGLPHMGLYTRRDPKTRTPYEEKSIWSKYKVVETGATIPWNIRRERDGEAVFEQFASEVLVNTEIKPEIFRLPGDAKLLDPDP